MLDLQKAFDTVNYTILLSKLHCIGFNEMTIEWFTSYFTGRSQLVSLMVFSLQRGLFLVVSHRGLYLAHSCS